MYSRMDFIRNNLFIRTSKIQTRFARTIFFLDIMNAIFQYDVVLISLNDKIIRYIF